MMSSSNGKSPARITTLAGVFVFGLLGLVAARNVPSTDGAPSAPSDNKYIGAAKCKSCHQAEKSGNQYSAWEKMKHARAFEVLASPEAKKLAAEAGIEDAQKSDKCLKCHVTAFGEPESAIKKGFDPKLGVQCESCHGPGDNHLRARIRAAAEGEQPEYVKIPADEIVITPPMATCLGCHNEGSPSFKPFCYYKRVAEVHHPNPLKPRKEKQMVCGCGDSCGCIHGCAEGKCAVPAKDE